MVNKSVLIMVSSIDLAAGLTTAAKAAGDGVICTQPWDVDEYHANPVDCHSFYHCSNGQPYLMPCVKGLVWNDKLNVCDLPSNFPCKQK